MEKSDEPVVKGIVGGEEEGQRGVGRCSHCFESLSYQACHVKQARWVTVGTLVRRGAPKARP